jgi:hypothetical protein
MSCLVLANDEPKQRVQVAKTEHVDLPAAGTVRLKNSTGELTVEGWDQPGVEITTVKSTKAEYASAEREKASHELDRVRIAMKRNSDELVIATEFPKSRIWPPSHPLGGATDFDLDYHIRVPRDTKLAVEHYAGEVYFDGITGDIHATALQGAIILHLPEEGQYTIDAKSNLGNVISDFPGSTKRRLWFGHEFVQSSAAPHKLYLRDKFGDIIILKIRKPPETPPLGQ